MRLRLRCLETKETRKLDLPDSCSIQQLSQALGASSPSQFLFSLNKKDELQTSSPEDSLRSLGVASGDLIYYSQDPSVFFASSGNKVSNQRNEIRFCEANSASADRETLVRKSNMDDAMGRQNSSFTANESVYRRDSPVRSTNLANKRGRVQNSSTGGQTGDDEMKDPVAENEGIPSAADVGVAEVEDDAAVIADGRKHYELNFLKKFLRDELAGDCSQKKLLIMAVHAVMLESGFALFDNNSGLLSVEVSFGNEQQSNSLFYTLPELLGNQSNLTETIAVKFQSLGHLLNVNGSLNKGGLVHRIYLDKCKFSQSLAKVWPRCVGDDAENDEGKYSSSFAEVFEFWKIVKDGLALPLLIDLCDLTGLPLPPCLMCLPTDLKMKILERLSGVDIARMACVCSEMRFLASNDELWKLKCFEEFQRQLVVAKGECSWKASFIGCWEQNKRRREALAYFPSRRRAGRPFFYPIRRDRYPRGFRQLLHMPPTGRQYGDWEACLL